MQKIIVGLGPIWGVPTDLDNSRARAYCTFGRCS